MKDNQEDRHGGRLVFSEQPGEFGGNQERLINRWYNGDAQTREALRVAVNSLFQKQLPDERIIRFLTRIKQEGCGFVAATNIILARYENRRKEFEQHFGVPYLTHQGKVNFEGLLLKFYFEQNDWHYLFNSSLRVKIPYPGLRAGDLKRSLFHFSQKYGEQVKGNWLLGATQEKIKKVLDSGELITMTSYFFKMNLIAPKFAKYQNNAIGFHTVILLSYHEEKQCFIASSWGKKYELYHLPKGSVFYKYTMS